MSYQIKYRNELNILDEADLTQIQIVNHFAKNGYENLYLRHNSKISGIVTLDDFLKGEIVAGIDREFVRSKNEVCNKQMISDIFLDYPYIDRISVIEDGNLICEIDGLVELPLQNGLSKNLMALRYVDMIKEELNDELRKYKRVLLIASNDICSFFKKNFPEISFDETQDISLLLNIDVCGEYDLILDFVYSRNIRKALGITSEKIISFSKLVTKPVLRKLKSYCDKQKVYTRFYRLQSYEKLTCLNSEEYQNSVDQIKAGVALKNTSYMSHYIAADDEREFLRKRLYHASVRIDNGYCFVQDDSRDSMHQVQGGIRNTSYAPEIQDGPRVYIYGPCTIYGFLTPDDKTVASIIQKKAVEDNVLFHVENRAGIHGYNELNSFVSALNTPVKSGDILIFYDTLDDLDFDEYPNAVEACNWFNLEKPKEETWFLDFPGHCNYLSNVLIAKHLYADIKEDISSTISPTAEDRKSYIDGHFNKMKLLKMTHSSCIEFFNKYSEDAFSNKDFADIGAIIIMNNYDFQQSIELARRALKQCEALYILKYNIDLDDIEQNEDLFEKSEITIEGKPIKIMRLGYYFYTNRYTIPEENEVPKNQECEFIERVLSSCILKEIGVSTRFIVSKDVNKDRIEILERIYREDNIKTICI